MGKCIRWSNENNQVMKDWFPVSSEECHKRLPHRTIRAIQAQAQRLGIKGKTRFIDLTGNFYGLYEVIRRGKDYVSLKEQYSTRWWVKCTKCGFEKLVLASDLKNSSYTTCPNCPQLEIGKMYGWLEPIERIGDYIDRKSKQHFQRFRMKCHYGAEGCKGTFPAFAGHVKSGGTKSCGCLRDEKARKMLAKKTGENHWNWKNGITELHDSIRKYIKNKIWKKECRERDNYTCQKCGKRGCKTNVHHCQIPFWKILERLIANGVTDVKDIPGDSKLWDTKNGCTLCAECHKEFHNIYGNNFTKEDFEEWMKTKTKKEVT